MMLVGSNPTGCTILLNNGMKYDTIIEGLKRLTLELSRVPTKTDINECEYLPSYNTLNRRGITAFGSDWLREFLHSHSGKRCKHCGEGIPFEKRMNVFCGSSCSATYNNLQKGKSTRPCENCGIEVVQNGRIAKFCSHECFNTHKRSKNVQKWLDGHDCGWKGKTRQLKNFVRRYLHETRGTACEECGWDEKHPIDGAVLTEVDHVDGNAENCTPENLKILCPNCHAKTPTFRRRNQKSSRTRR